MSAQLSFPPDRPTMMRSPSAIMLKSWIAFVTFRALFDSRCVEYPTRLILSRPGSVRVSRPRREICVSVLRDDVNHRPEKPGITRRAIHACRARVVEEGHVTAGRLDRHRIHVARRLD